MNACLHCGRTTKNPKYCSRSCAATRTNQMYPKRRKKPRSCKRCNASITHLPGRRTCCLECNPSYKDWEAITLGEMRGRRRYQKHSAVRDRARQQFVASGRPLRCCVCGYDTHVDICHVRALHTFPANTPLRIANASNNLMALCPNHHWEFDHGLLPVSSLGFPDFDHLHAEDFSPAAHSS